MNTINQGFNEAWNRLAKLFPSAGLHNGESLAMDTLSFRVTKRDWPNLLTDIVDVLTIGQRNQWLDMHQDYQGRPVLFYVREEIGKQE